MVKKNPVFIALLLIIALMLLAKGVAGQGMMGEFPLPAVVKMTGEVKPITIDVSPKLVIANPYQTVGFRMSIRIPEHPDNRRVAYSADCGANAYSTQQDVDRITITKIYEMRVVRDCMFVATLFRITKGKVKQFQVHQEVTVSGG